MPQHSREVTEPWRPSGLSVHGIYKCSTRSRSTGKHGTKFDVRWSVDGRQFQRRFPMKGHADEFARRLKDEFAAGWPFDPKARQFVEPRSDAPTVLSTTDAYTAERWPGWAPKTRRENIRYLNRVRADLLRAGAPSPPDAVAHYLATASLRPNANLDDTAAEGRDWLAKWSRPVEDVTPEQARAHFHAHTGRLSAASQQRALAALRGWWNQVTVDAHATRDVFAGVKLTGQGKRKATGVQQVDADLVLTPQQVSELADAMPSERDAVLVLVMGYGGLRGGEAVGVTTGDVSSPDSDGNLWLRARRSARDEADDWLDPNDDPEWGPAKHRDEGDERWAPLPAGRIADRVAAFAETRPAGALLVAGDRGGRLNMGNWRARVWCPVRDRLYGHHRKLGQLTPHDLRHAAATMWIRAGVSLPLARRWGGWASTSVLLDVYAGVMPSEDSDALASVRALLNE